MVISLGNLDSLDEYTGRFKIFDGLMQHRHCFHHREVFGLPGNEDTCTGESFTDTINCVQIRQKSKSLLCTSAMTSEKTTESTKSRDTVPLSNAMLPGLGWVGCIWWWRCWCPIKTLPPSPASSSSSLPLPRSVSPRKGCCGFRASWRSTCSVRFDADPVMLRFKETVSPFTV